MLIKAHSNEHLLIRVSCADILAMATRDVIAPVCIFNSKIRLSRVPLWIFAVIFQLLNVYRWYTLFAVSFMPPAILLLVGTKLEIIIMEMAQQIQERTTIVEGVPVVERSNKYFWFNRPELILLLIHFTLFQNAFQMAYFLWTWFEFGITSCFHENLPVILAKVILGVAFQVLCSYITFPLYALVTQVWEGEGVIKYGTKFIGATDPQKSEPGTIRGDLAVVVSRWTKHIPMSPMEGCPTVFQVSVPTAIGIHQASRGINLILC